MSICGPITKATYRWYTNAIRGGWGRAGEKGWLEILAT